MYAQLTDGLGAFELAIEMRHVTDDQRLRVVGWSPVTRVEFARGDRLQTIDTVFALRHVPFREPGLYEIRVLADSDAPDGWAPLAGATCELRILDSRLTP